MKKAVHFLVLVVFALLSVAGHAQKRFDVKPFGLLRSSGTAKLGLGQSRDEAIQVLGAPTKVDNVYSELERKRLDVLYYNANKLYFLNDELITFELHDNTLVFGKSTEEAFRIGAKIIGDAAEANSGNRYLVDNIPIDDLKVHNKPGKCANVSYQRMASSYTRYGDARTDGLFQLLFDRNNTVVFIGLLD